jgi:hypothetical protein
MLSSDQPLKVPGHLVLGLMRFRGHMAKYAVGAVAKNSEDASDCDDVRMLHRYDLVVCYPTRF